MTAKPFIKNEDKLGILYFILIYSFLVKDK